MASPQQGNLDPEPPSYSAILRLVPWFVLLAMIGALTFGRVQQQTRWDAYVSVRETLVRNERRNPDSLWQRTSAGYRGGQRWIEDQLGIKLKPAEPKDPPAAYWPQGEAFVADKLSGKLELHIWISDTRIVGVMGLLRDDSGLLWGPETDIASMNIWDRSGRRHTANSAPAWIRLSVCDAPSWLVAIDYTTRFAWIAWIPFTVLALMGRRPWQSAQVVLAATIMAFTSASLDVGLCGQPASLSHVAPLYAGFPLSIFLLVWTRSRRAERNVATKPAVVTLAPEIIGDCPDWAKIPADVYCPLCGYNLRGLERPLCPECGLQFRWVELFEAARTRHAYLYEHNSWWNIGAFFKTMFCGLNPGRFWCDLSPVHRIVPRRLFVYFLLCQMFVLMPMLAGFVLERVQLVNRLRAGFGFLSQPRYSSATLLDMVGSVLHAPAGDTALYWWYAFAPWPLITLAVLMVCQTTFRRAGVKPTHVVRVVAYTSDIIALAGILMAAGCLAAFGIPDEYAAIMLVLVTLTMYPLLVFRLATACRLYLRIRHAWPTALATQAVFLLTLVLMRVMTWP